MRFHMGCSRQGGVFVLLICCVVDRAATEVERKEMQFEI